MNDSGTIVGSDKVRLQHLKIIWRAAFEVGKQRLIAQLFGGELAALQLAKDLDVAQFFAVPGNRSGAEDVGFVALLCKDVRNVRPNRQTKV